ncbi:ER oxidoreductin [Rhodotorula paludigena]|uniref:ER oxidoreductin n=1 Tax=Rhodotorula paludigena TaxID=86838 RepID=UPI00316D2B47
MHRPPLPLAAAAALVALSTVASSTSLDHPRSGFLQDVLESKGAGQNYCKPTGQIHDACCDYETVESVNEDLFGRLHELVATPYFRYHKVDLAKECPFWEEDGSCMNRACGVETTDEDHIPEAWRSYTLGKLNETSARRTSSPAGCSEISDSDFCVLEDELDSEGVYVDLLENPERFTGYAGPSSSRVWKAIYEENCFTPVPFVDASRSTADGGSGFAHVDAFSSGAGTGMGMGGGGFGGLAMGGWGESEKRLMGSLAGPRDPDEEVCLEKRVFYRVISGLHASISVHICDDYLDQSTGQWAPNLDCFITRIGQHPERLENMYFTYVLLLRALSRSGPQLVRTLEDTAGEVDTRAKLAQLVDVANGCPSTFDETSMFSGTEAQLLKDEFKDHFRNVSRIMDCVGCDKCRLWGKMQVTGLGTALKLLFSYDGASPLASPSDTALRAKDDPHAVVLSRSEVVAFVNTLHRLSESLAAVDKFRTLWAHRGEERGEERPASARRPQGESPVQVEERIAVDEERDAAALPTASSPLPTSAPADAARSVFSSAAQVARSPFPSARAPPRAAGNASTAGEAFSLGTLWTRLVSLCGDGWSRCVDLVAGVGGAVAGAERKDEL